MAPSARALPSTIKEIAARLGGGAGARGAG
jgi:hypothetical protein